MKTTAAVAAALGCLVIPASAAAQAPTPTPTPTPTPIPAPAPPVAGKLSVAVQNTFRDHKRLVAVTGRSFAVVGAVTPYMAGQTVTVRLYRNGKRIKSRRVALVRSPDGRAGVFRRLVKRGEAGSYAVKVSHDPTPQLVALRAPKIHVTIVSGAVGVGQRGVAVRLLQRGLSKLHYATSRSGIYDAATQRAVLAWRKLTRRARTFTASRDVLLGVLKGKGAWKVRHPGDGHHVEADVSLQVLALVDGKHVHRIYHMSSGKPSTPTVLGKFRVYRKDPGTNAKGMVFSSYFIGGYAIHGYASVPTFPASHGCLRVPVPDAVPIFNWLAYGDRVDVYP
jgi:hypothetical protein